MYIATPCMELLRIIIKDVLHVAARMCTVTAVWAEDVSICFLSHITGRVALEEGEG